MIFRVIKMLVEITWMPNDTNYQHSVRFCKCSVRIAYASAQTFGRFGNSSAACACFWLSIKRPADGMFVCFHLSILCCFVYYQKIIKRIIVLEIYVTYDVISSNLVIFLLCRFLVQTFLNLRKLLSSHVKNALTSQLSKLVKMLFVSETQMKTLNKNIFKIQPVS